MYFHSYCFVFAWGLDICTQRLYDAISCWLGGAYYTAKLLFSTRCSCSHQYVTDPNISVCLFSWIFDIWMTPLINSQDTSLQSPLVFWFEHSRRSPGLLVAIQLSAINRRGQLRRVHLRNSLKAACWRLCCPQRHGSKQWCI